MPVRTKDEQVTSDDGVNAARTFFMHNRCKFQEVDLRNDIGKDVYLDVATNGVVSYLCVALQIKSGRSYRTSKGEYFIPVGKHAESWRLHTIPVFGIVYDPDDALMRWADLTGYLRAHPRQKSGRIPVSCKAILTVASLAGEFTDALIPYVDRFGRIALNLLMAGDLQMDGVFDAWARRPARRDHHRAGAAEIRRWDDGQFWEDALPLRKSCISFPHSLYERMFHCEKIVWLEGHMKRVLSIDGGGIRGVIPAVICREIENNLEVRLASLFDVIAGTSTGGILAMGLAVPGLGNNASSLPNFYFKHGSQIFSDPSNRITQLWASKFNNDELKKAVSGVFGSVRISQAETELFITSYDTQLRRPVYFTRSKAKRDKSADLEMKDIAMGTSAAPMIFPAHSSGEKVLIDGGVVANNPACLGFAHAKRLWPDDEVMLLSIGTGAITRPLMGLKRNNSWGQLRWVRPLLDTLFTGTAATVDDFFRYTSLPNYLRLQGQLNEETEDLDDASDASVTGLTALGEQIYRNRQSEIGAFMERAIQVGQGLDLKITDTFPDRMVKPGPLPIQGTVDNYRNEDIYALTGKLGRFWPSARIVPNGRRWTTNLNSGHAAAEVIITVVKADPMLANYIEYYRSTAEITKYPGIQLPEKLTGVLDHMVLALDYRK